MPSLTSHAFFRPMSSQRLQAQRRARPRHVGQSAPSIDGFSETDSNIHRHSLGSSATGQPELSTYHDLDLPPPSRGTEISEPDERNTINASPTGNATVQSAEGSERPLRMVSSDPRPKQLGTENNKQKIGLHAPVQKSPMSFSANFLVSTKRETPGLKEGRGPKTIPSAKAPGGGALNALYEKTPKLGFNYQYFSGNTKFCWGGRLQNTRDRPANILTGILVILPSALFFVYSYGTYDYLLSNIHANRW